MNQLGTTYLSETLQKREEKNFYYKTRPGVLDHGRRLRDFFLGYYTWRILRIMKDLQRAQEAQV